MGGKLARVWERGNVRGRGARRAGPFGRAALAAALLACCAGAALPPGLSAQQAPAAAEAWQLIQPAQSSLVFARDGALLGEIGRQWRTSVPLASLPRYVPDAFIAVEDHRFWQHEGVDVVGIAGALKDRLLGSPRGASTITQQLVGNMHPDLIDRRDISISRKLREQAAAIEMERHYSKATILEAYLNQLDFGHGWFGIDAAARHYFGKSAAQLTLAEAASLAALPRSPPLYDPIAHPERNRERRNLVLSLMADQGLVSRQSARQAQRTPVLTVPNAGLAAPARYVLDRVRREADRQGISVIDGGYRIYTTIDAALQRDAVAALRDGTARIEARPGWTLPALASYHGGAPDYLQGAIVAMDPATGDLLALVGGRDYGQSQFDRAYFARRQPGSAIKPIVYAAAIGDSIPANEIVADTALAIPMADGSVYRPADADGGYRGPITVRDALAQSRNSVAVQLGLRAGMDSIAALGERLGISSPIAPFPSSAIGASVLSPIDLVRAYTAFDDPLGAVAHPTLVRRIADHAGRTVYADPAAPPDSVLDPRVAFIVRDMMRDVVAYGTATSVRRWVPDSIPVAGKTGTTDENTDAWFVGLTPDLVAGVWLGFDDPRPMPGVSGGGDAAPIWGEMVGRWYRERGSAPSGWGELPADLVAVELDRLTGQPATELTPPERRYTEYFLPGTEPGALEKSFWRLFTWGPIAP